MSDKTLEILIKTLADTHGAEAVRAALKNVAAEATEQGKASAASAGSVQSAIAGVTSEVSKHGEASKEAGGKVDFLNLKKSELKKLAGDLTRAFPALGSALKTALDPRLVGITLLIQLFRILQDQIKATIDLLNPSNWTGGADAIASGKRAFDEAAVSANLYWHELNRAKSELSAIASKNDENVDAIRRQAQAEAELRNARMGVEIARINAAEKSGGLTPEQAAIQRGAVQQRYAAAERTAKDLEENRALNALLQHRTELLDYIGRIQGELPDKQQLAAEAEARLARSAARRSIDAQNIAAAEAKIAEYQAELEKRENGGMRSAVFDKLTDSSVRQAMQSEIETLDRLKAMVAKDSAEKVSRDSADKSVVSDASAAEAELKAARQKLDQLNSRVDDQQGKYFEGIRHRGALGKLRNEESAIQSRSRFMDEAKSLADIAGSGGHLDPNSQQFLVVLTQAITGQRQTFESAIKIVQQATGQGETQARVLVQYGSRLDAVSQRLAQLESRSQLPR